MKDNGQTGCRPTRLACGHEVVDPRQIHYCSYLSLDTLGKLSDPHAATPSQHRRPLHPDEAQFIAVHQVCELAFEQIIRELRRIIEEMHPDKPDFSGAFPLIDRLIEWMKLATHAIHPLNTMTPENFGIFRSALGTASGLESSNFRRIELLSGIRPEHRFEMPMGPSQSHQFTYRQLLDRPIGLGEGQLRTRLWIEPEFDQIAAGPTVAKHFTGLLAKAQTTEQKLYQWHATYRPGHSNTPRDRGLAQLIKLADALYKYEQAMHTHRLEHIHIVQKQINGSAPGTAGTSGIPYLKLIADQSCFFPSLAHVKRSQNGSR